MIDPNVQKMSDQMQETLNKVKEDFEQPKFVCTPDNNYGMLGHFTGIQVNDEFYTIFSTWDDSVIVRICQHENLDQAEAMANELTEYSMQM